MNMTTCPLCGYEFDKAGLVCHTSCPLSSRCSIVCCPNCGYQMPDEDRSGTVELLRRAWRWLTAAGDEQIQPDADGSRPLTTLRVGDRGEVDGIRSAAADRLTYLGVLGVVPGCQIILRQRNPAYVVQVDETEVALDAQIAREILVRTT
jgi:Fe2+ transport system protein FeoA